MHKKNLMIISIMAIMTVGLLIPRQSFAFWPFDSSSSKSTFPSLIQKMIDKFKLNSSEVQKVIDDERTERQKEMQAKYEEWLDILVKAGKIDETQKQAVLKKHEELQNQRQNEWQQRETERQELENWAKENNIDVKYLFGGFGMRGGHWKGK